MTKQKRAGQRSPTAPLRCSPPSWCFPLGLLPCCPHGEWPVLGGSHLLVNESSRRKASQKCGPPSWVPLWRNLGPLEERCTLRKDYLLSAVRCGHVWDRISRCNRRQSLACEKVHSLDSGVSAGEPQAAYPHRAGQCWEGMPLPCWKHVVSSALCPPACPFLPAMPSSLQCGVPTSPLMQGWSVLLWGLFWYVMRNVHFAVQCLRTGFLILVSE